MNAIERRRELADIASTARSPDSLEPFPAHPAAQTGRSRLAGPTPAAPRATAPTAPARPPSHPLVAFAVAPGAVAAMAGNAASARIVGVAASAIASRIVQARMDAFRVGACGPYTVPGEAGPVLAPAQFRMNGGFNQALGERHAADLAVACRGKVAAYEVQFARWGRATPSAIARITQALIDAGRLPPPSPGATTIVDRIRAMQWTHGVGFDCAGYVQQALLAVHGLSGSVRDRTSVGLVPAVGNEGFIDMNAPLKRERFRRTEIAAATPGAIVKLDPPKAEAARGEPGHAVMVYANRDAAEGGPIALAHFRAKGSDVGDGAARFLASGNVRVVEVDSSWGAEDGKPFGGVRRDVWLHDETSGAWGYYSPHVPVGFHVDTLGPCGEIFAGAFLPR